MNINLIKCLIVTITCFSSAIALAAFNTAPPATGAFQSGVYRNIYAELGKAGIQTKVDDAFNKMFYGTDNEKLYYTYGTDEAYIKAIDSNDIRTEGMSWGMTVAVMMNKQTEFNRLWKFAYNRMKNDSNQSFPGTYAWQVRDTGNGIQILDRGPAADGELYFAFALFNAAGRWGNGIGINDYQTQANAILDTLRTHLIEQTYKQVIFTPFDKTYTDPSYHLPAFYSYFASVASSNKTFWADVATASRTFLQSHLSYGNGGISTYLANFNGYPVQGNKFAGQSHPGEVSEMDSWRVIMNIAMDAHLIGAQTWHKNAVNTLLYFLSHSPEGVTSGGMCGGGYSQKYFQNGGNYGICNTNNWTHQTGQTATNAAALFASTNSTDASNFADALWNSSWPTGTYRYYHGSLYMLATLHLSGNFKLYIPSGGNNSNGVTTKARGTNGYEHINLKIGGSTVANWTLTTTYQNYVYSGNATGDIQVQYDNDGVGGDVQVDYVLANNETRQAENMSHNTGLYANGSCGGGGYGEWMQCNGVIGFGLTTDCFSGNCSSNINKLNNGTFNTDMNGWAVSYGNGATATNGVQGGSAYVWISTGGTNIWDVQLFQNTTITQGKSYKLDFDARITEGSTRSIGVNIEKNISPWTWYGGTSFSLSTSWNHYSYTFNSMSASDAQARLIFQLGTNNSDVNLDNIALVEM